MKGKLWQEDKEKVTNPPLSQGIFITPVSVIYRSNKN
jgi:hypothetical protein